MRPMLLISLRRVGLSQAGQVCARVCVWDGTQLVIVDFSVGGFCAWECIEELELDDGRRIERSSVFASVPDDGMREKNEGVRGGRTCGRDRPFATL